MDTRAGLAAYRRVVEEIKDEILAGNLKPNQKLLGNRSLAEKYKVALATLQKALKVLQDEGWLTATPGVGVFVAPSLPVQGGGPITVSVLAEQIGSLHAAVEALGQRVQQLEDERRD
ncbi:winged helix-turn-helix domain-containing protein [Actinosynnema pretiosum]|uniref:GntR family transcriptional regulator n=1 Tax=Actinosynnema pretiosum TaxID=42197 RepID=A0A290Z3U6_9PSEU|nr:winged helix-turn-helix domain-containing protein [Actinosynnema pretiosum]ATE53639.1 GntR family transcriptional regulator [Actinosynnema pretiosum]